MKKSTKLILTVLTIFVFFLDIGSSLSQNSCGEIYELPASENDYGWITWLATVLAILLTTSVILLIRQHLRQKQFKIKYRQEEFNFKNKIQCLQNSKDRFLAIVDTMSHGIVELNKGGMITYVNKSLCRMLGYPPEEIIGHGLLDREKNKEHLQRFIKHVYKNQPKPFPFFSTRVRKNSTLVDVHVDWNYKRDAKYNIIGYVALLTDITERLKTERLLKKEYNLLQVLMDNIPYTIYFKDTECRYTRINRAQADALCLNGTEEAVGKTDFDFYPKQYAVFSYTLEQKILISGEAVIDHEEEIQIEDSSIWLLTTKMPIKHNKEITGIVGISRDITEGKNTQLKLKEAKEKAERSDRLKTAFLANMSHEIRTPMNAIIGFAEHLRDPDIIEEEKQEYISYISSNGDDLLNLIDDIIDTAKLEAGQLKLYKENFNINKLLFELKAGFAKILTKKQKTDIELKIHLPKTDKDYVIHSDRHRIKQILVNLIGNAIKFTKKGHIRFGVMVRDQQFIDFFVEDTGIGIPKEKIENVFDRFWLLEEILNKNKHGTGLGLAISKNLIRLLGGEIGVNSTEGQGSTFYFRLPNIYFDKKINQKAVMTPQKLNDWSDKAILVAEDVELNFKLIEIALRKTGVKLFRAIDGQEAIRVFEQNRGDIDLILMDVQMPIMNGYEASRAIKTIDATVPIIAQTAFAMSGEKEKSIKAGCDNYITKPIMKQKLINLIGTFFNKQNQ